MSESEFTAFPHAFSVDHWMSDDHKALTQELREEGKIVDWLAVGVGHPLPPALAATVPFAIHDLVVRGGPSEADWQWARDWSDTLAAHGDNLLYRGEKKGESAKLFAELVRVVATLAFMPGGITLFDTHYVAYRREESQS